MKDNRKSLSVINIDASLAPSSKMSAFSGMCLVIGLMIGSGIVIYNQEILLFLVFNAWKSFEGRGYAFYGLGDVVVGWCNYVCRDFVKLRLLFSFL